MDLQYSQLFYNELYHKIQKDSEDFQRTVNFLFITMKQTNVSIGTAIKELNLVRKLIKNDFIEVSIFI